MSDQTNIKKIITDYNNKSYETCLTDINLMLKRSPNNKTLLNIQGMSYFNLGEFDKAIKVFENLSRDYDDFYEGFNNYGTILLAKEKYEDALSILKQAIDINPERPEARHAYVSVLIKLSQNDEYDFEILKNIETLMKRDPNDFRARQLGGYFYKKKRDWDNAVKFFEKSVNANVIPDLLECIYEQGDQKEIIRYIEFCNKTAKYNNRIACLTDFICDQIDVLNPYKFCPQSINYIKDLSFHKFFKEKEFINFHQEILSYDFIFTQSNEKIIDSNPSMESLLKHYFEIFEHKEIDFIEEWPRKYNINISMFDKDKNCSRNYKSWLTILFPLNNSNNLKSVKTKISFDYIVPERTMRKRKNREKIISLKVGDCVAFPSFVKPNVKDFQDGVNLYTLNINKLT